MIKPEVLITDLKTKYVVFKRVKKVNWYDRGNHYGKCNARAKTALLYDKEQAQARVENLNKNRKAYKFRYECAEKHFVNNWSVKYISWNDLIQITNNPMAFNDVVKYKKNSNRSLNYLKPGVIKDLDRRITELQIALEQTEKSYENSLKALLVEKERRMLEIKSKISNVSFSKDYLNNTDLDIEYVEKHTTDTDKKAYILFGNKDQTKE